MAEVLLQLNELQQARGFYKLAEDFAQKSDDLNKYLAELKRRYPVLDHTVILEADHLLILQHVMKHGEITREYCQAELLCTSKATANRKLKDLIEYKLLEMEKRSGKPNYILPSQSD